MRRRIDFLRTRRLGSRLQTAHFVIYLAKLPDRPQPRLGLAVSREIGNAVVRNRVKRRLRESFRRSLKTVLGQEQGFVMVVVARRGAAELRTAEVTAELIPAVSRLAERLQASARQ